MIIERELYRQIEPYLHSPEAIIITGMRRTGKTTLLRYIADRLGSDNTVWLDLENPLHQKYFEAEDYEQVRVNLETLGLNTQQPGFVFLDEIQLAKTLPSVVKYLVDHYPIKFFLTGSSSFYLKHQFTESLAGRKFVFELWPLNFREFLALKGERLVIPSSGTSLAAPIFTTLARLFEEYLLFGGFPGVVAQSSQAAKRRALEDIFSSYYQLEVAQLADFRKTSVVRDLMLLLLQRVGNKLDVQKIAAELGVSRPTVYEYIGFLEQTYFITLVPRFSTRQDAAVRGVAKVYAVDSGLVNTNVRVDDGALFEQAVFQLLRLQGEARYYQRRGAEIDFILNRKTAYEVKMKADARDVQRVRTMAEQVGLSQAYVIAKERSNLEGVISPFGL